MTRSLLCAPRCLSSGSCGCRVGVRSLLALLIVLLVACISERSPAADLPDSLRITYVGNEGFLIEVEGRKVLIDALYRTGVAGYVVHPPERRRLLEQAASPFDDVDVVLATHYHADHFDPQTVGKHLIRNGSGVFISTRQAVAELESMFPAWRHIAARVSASSPAKDDLHSFAVDSIRVTTLDLHHGLDRPIENLGFLIEMGGWKLLHVGDSEASPEEFGEYELVNRKIDVVFVPYWYLAYPDWDGRIQPTFGDARLVAMHLPPPDDPHGYMSDLGGFDGVVNKIRSKYPSSIIFREPMESVAVQARR